MKHLSTLRLTALLAWLLALLPRLGAAQTTAPPWVLAAAARIPSATGFSEVDAVAVDASGNVFVTGFFTLSVTFGSTTLVSAGTTDLFVAKYVPATGTWAWAVRGGGTSNDYGSGIAVSGSSVYVTGSVANNRADVRAVTLQQASTSAAATPVLGASTSSSDDMLVAKYVDQGSSAALAWMQVAGGTGGDAGAAIAASGGSVYVVGSLTNDRTDRRQVVFGSNGTTTGTVMQYGASALDNSDLLVAKWTDNGSSATVAWTQVGGGLQPDEGHALAVSGSSVYVAGNIINTRANGSNVVFGGAGTAAGTLSQYGASNLGNSDLLVAKYVDQGSSATVAWTQVGGGEGNDVANAVAVNGSSVYVLGNVDNTSTNRYNVVFGGTGAVAGTVSQVGASTTLSTDLVLAKYQDNGLSATVRWTQVAGGSSTDCGYALAASGSSVYAAGFCYNDRANGSNVVFGGAGTAAGTLPQPGLSARASFDIVLARYTDNGLSATINWTQIGGGDSDDVAYCATLVGSKFYVGGNVLPPAAFGPFSIAATNPGEVAIVAALDVTSNLAAASASAAPAFNIYPSPAIASTAAHLSGAAPATAGQVMDALGRAVATFRTDAAGAALLPAGLAPGVYAVRVGAATGRLVLQ